MMPVEAGIQLLHLLLYQVVVGAFVQSDHNPIRSHKVINRSPFFQEFGIRDDFKLIFCHAPLA